MIKAFSIQEQQNYTAEPSAKESILEKLKVLVIDDKKIMGDMFDMTLGSIGHEVTCLNNPRDVQKHLKDHTYDITFLDIVMPEMDGVDVLKELKMLSPQMPVVMMSGFSVEEKRSKVTELGAIHFLQKPFDFTDVKDAVKLSLGIDI